MLGWWQAVVLGLVEGITEYLPVSSTGHLILTASLLRLDRPGTKDALDAYLVVVQGGAILAVLWLYWPRVVQMARGLLGRGAGGGWGVDDLARPAGWSGRAGPDRDLPADGPRDRALPDARALAGHVAL